MWKATAAYACGTGKDGWEILPEKSRRSTYSIASSWRGKEQQRRKILPSPLYPSENTAGGKGSQWAQLAHTADEFFFSPVHLVHACRSIRIEPCMEYSSHCICQSTTTSCRTCPGIPSRPTTNSPLKSILAVTAVHTRASQSNESTSSLVYINKHKDILAIGLA